MLQGTAAFIPIARSKGSSAAAFMIEEKLPLCAPSKFANGVKMSVSFLPFLDASLLKMGLIF
jgi:hypothetical protein